MHTSDQYRFQCSKGFGNKLYKLESTGRNSSSWHIATTFCHQHVRRMKETKLHFSPIKLKEKGHGQSQRHHQKEKHQGK